MNTRLKILNIWVDPVDDEEALSRVKKFIQWGNRPHSVFASNPEKNFTIPKDALLYDTFKEADLLIPDGIGIVLAVRILYGLKLVRVPGVALMGDICRLAAREGTKVFVYGAREKVNRRAVELLKYSYPSLIISGRSNGFVKDSEMPYLIDQINGSRAEILFLALGSPKQEKWFANYKNSLEYVKVCQGIGGTLDVIAGNVKRAPEIWQKYSLEWLYRLISEPKRLKKQRVLPVFAAMVLIARLRNLARSNRRL